MSYTTPLVNPCKDCPYRVGGIDTFETLHVEKDWFEDGEIQHACHSLTNFYELEDDAHLGCLGSKLFAQKMLGNIKDDRIKTVEEMV